MPLKQPQKIRVNFNDLTEANDTAEELLAYNGQLFTGYAVLGYHSNGNIESEEEFRNGITMGWVNVYYPNGNLKRETLCVISNQNSIAFNKYDINGNKIDSYILISQENYNQLINQYHLLD
jgi:antitoxin component YwqK of YwqJK toxin-antitoxin module